MLNYKEYIILAVLIAAVVINEITPPAASNFSDVKKELREYDKRLLETYERTYDSNNTQNKFWDIKTASQSKPVEEKKQLNIKKLKNSNTICINESCYRLLGIYKKQNDDIATFYNKDLKNKIVDIKKHELLNEIVEIWDITSNRIDFKELNSARQWDMKIFDVNGSKYKPKEPSNETE